MTQGIPQFVNPTKIEKFVSPWNNWSGGSEFTIDLGDTFKGKEPDNIYLDILVKSATNGFLPGEIIKSFGTTVDFNSAQNFDDGYVVTIKTDLKTIEIRTGDSLYMVDGSSDTGGTGFTNTQFRIRAEKLITGDQPDITRVGLVPLDKKFITSQTSIDFPDIFSKYNQDYDSFIFDFDVAPTTDAVQLMTRASIDGSTFISATNYSYIYNYINIGGSDGNGASANDSGIKLSNAGATGFGNASNEHGIGQLTYKPKFDGGQYHLFKIDTQHYQTGGQATKITGAGSYDNSTALTGLQFLFTSGNITGRVTVLGQRKTT